ncbi:MAG: SpoIIE family protein phosphatase [Victivallaceae bacterium]|nr:SpoIIE family protein phosphatase [Victivallaceae bacterium]
MFKRIGIKAKILIIMLFLAVISFGAAAVLTLENIKKLGGFTLYSCNVLGDRTFGDSKDALLKHANEELLSLVTGQAMIANVQFERIEDEMAMLVTLTGRYLQEGNNAASGKDERRFLAADKPSAPFSRSRITVYAKDTGEKYRRNLVLAGQLHPLLKFIYGNHADLDMAYVCTAHGYYVSYPWSEPQKGFSPFERDWYREAVKANGGQVWIGPYISAHKSKIILTCAKAVKNTKGEIIAVCGVDITVKEITRSFIGMRMLQSGRAFLVDKEGNILARRDMKEEGMVWHESYQKENLLKSPNSGLRKLAEKMIAGEEGVTKVGNVAGEAELYIAYAPVPVTGWSVGVAVKAEVLAASVYKAELAMEKNIHRHRIRVKDYFNRNLNIYLVTGAAVLVLVVICGLIFSHKITAPILMLKGKALRIMEGNFASGIHLNTGDELERLDKSFDNMAREISRYMEHVRTTVRDREKTEQEFAVAANIQYLMLPAKFREVPELTIESFLKPAHAVSGDFYNYIMTDDKHLFFCIGKVAGKGVPAAMLMARVMTLLSHLGTMKTDPEKLLLIVNNALIINNKTDMAVSAFCGCLNIKTGRLIFSNAGHVPSVYIHEGGLSALKIEESPALGIDTADRKAFRQNTLRLSPGDVLLFTTNGIDKVENARGEIFEERHLLSLLKDFKGSVKSLVKFTVEHLKEFYGDDISRTDIALLAIEYKGGSK